MNATKSIDLKGLCCSEPIIRLAREIKAMQPGEILLVEADRDSMRKDVPAFCRQTRNVLLEHSEEQGLLRYWIQRKPAPP